MRLSAVVYSDSQDAVVRAALFRGLEPLDDQGESGEARRCDMLALLLGCKNIDSYWRGRHGG